MSLSSTSNRRLDIAADLCAKHPHEKQAMIWERDDGARREFMRGASNCASARCKAGKG